MKDFFTLLLNKIEILTGIRQLERLQSKPLQLKELMDECINAASNYPIKEDIMKKVLMDAVSNDPDFIGLNVKWVRKTLNLYCQVHALTKGNTKEEEVDLVKAYTNFVSFWNERSDLDPHGERIKMAIENLERVTNGEAPIDDLEAIKIMGGIYQEQIKNTFMATIDNPKHSGSRLKEQFDTYAPMPQTLPEDSALNDYLTRQANATPNQETKEGIGDVTEAKVDSTDTPQPDENFSQQRENIINPDTPKKP